MVLLLWRILEMWGVTRPRLREEEEEAHCHHRHWRESVIDYAHIITRGHRCTWSQTFDISKKKLLKTLTTVFPWWVHNVMSNNEITHGRGPGLIRLTLNKSSLCMSPQLTERLHLLSGHITTPRRPSRPDREPDVIYVSDQRKLQYWSNGYWSNC